MYSSIDYLFEELPSPLFCLPAEIRNQIYEYVVLVETDPIHIQADGMMKVAALVSTCRQIRSEAYGFIMRAVSDRRTKIVGQVRDYNIKPLLATLSRLAEQTGVDRSDLASRTKVNLVGALDVGNLREWVEGNLRDKHQVPLFEFDRPILPEFEKALLFDGLMSVKHAIMSHRAMGAVGGQAEWARLTRELLDELDKRNFNVVPPRHREQSVEELLEAVVQTIAVWGETMLEFSRQSFEWLVELGPHGRDATRQKIRQPLVMIYLYQTEVRRVLRQMEEQQQQQQQ